MWIQSVGQLWLVAYVLYSHSCVLVHHTFIIMADPPTPPEPTSLRNQRLIASLIKENQWVNQPKAWFLVG